MKSNACYIKNRNQMKTNVSAIHCLVGACVIALMNELRGLGGPSEKVKRQCPQR